MSSCRYQCQHAWIVNQSTCATTLVHLLDNHLGATVNGQYGQATAVHMQTKLTLHNLLKVEFIDIGRQSQVV